MIKKDVEERKKERKKKGLYQNRAKALYKNITKNFQYFKIIYKN